MNNILLIKDLLDLRDRKEKELKFYNNQLKELKSKMMFIKTEIDLSSGL